MFKPVVKDRLFYNQFKYSFGFTLNEVSCLRQLDHFHIDRMIERRRTWRDIAQQRWNKSKHIVGTIITRRQSEITDDTVAALHELAEILLTTLSEFKLVVSVNHGRVYTNNLKLIKQLDSLGILSSKDYTQARISRPKNTIQLKNPKHKFRSYFKIVKITEQQKNNLVNFLTNQQNSVRLSPALIPWIKEPFRRTQDYFFIDHHNMQWLTMLALVNPGLIRKTLEIIAAK